MASRRVGVPFYLHAFDDYIYQWIVPWMRSFARRAEGSLIRGTSKVIVPNEFMGQTYAARYGVETSLVHNPSLSTGCDDPPEATWPAHPGEVRIVYTGALYHAQSGAFWNLIAALEDLNRPEVIVHVYTAQTRTQLEQEGIRGPFEIHEHLSPTESRVVQQQADILFLPLAFDPSIRDVIRTSAPGKMGEYLASGRPVLVHAPADSYVSWYFKEHGCGLVINENQPEVLASGIRSIIEDQALRERLVARAQAAARRDFSLPAVRAAYWGTFEAD
jgi:glycosyltransferase involved in cell wall biosynthesis